MLLLLNRYKNSFKRNILSFTSTLHIIDFYFHRYIWGLHFTTLLLCIDRSQFIITITLSRVAAPLRHSLSYALSNNQEMGLHVRKGRTWCCFNKQNIKPINIAVEHHGRRAAHTGKCSIEHKALDMRYFLRIHIYLDLWELASTLSRVGLRVLGYLDL